MKKYFPRAGAYFNTSGAGAAYPWNKANLATGSVNLEGPECLVFFLGGIPQQVSAGVGTGWSVTGFNRDPANPFALNIDEPDDPAVRVRAAAAGRRRRRQGIPSYIDPLSAGGVNLDQRPYAYFSAYGNNGYDPNDVNQGDGTAPAVPAEMDEEERPHNTGPLPILRAFVVNFVTQNTPNRVAVSAPPSPYTNGDPLANPVAYQNPQTFQLISAGRDGLWGLGGGYDGSSPGARLPIYSGDATHVFTLSGGSLTANAIDATTMRVRERDNITNFAGGRLD